MLLYFGLAAHVHRITVVLRYYCILLDALSIPAPWSLYKLSIACRDSRTECIPFCL